MTSLAAVENAPSANAGLWKEPDAKGPDSAAFDAASAIRAAARETGISPLAQVRDYLSVAFGPGKLTLGEFYDFRLYDRRALDAADRAAFLGKKRQKDLLARICPMAWRPVIGDKGTFYAVMKGLGYATPDLFAVLHRSRQLGSVPALRDAAALRSWLLDEAQYPFFGKPLDGMFSLGTVTVDSVDRQRRLLQLAGGTEISVDAFVAFVVRHLRGGYLFQERLHPHPVLAEMAGPRLSTLRLVVLLEDGKASIFRALWKIAANGNIADNFWRDGNMLAAIDAASGTIVRVVRGKGPSQDVLDAHPETGARLVGIKMPDWEAACDLVLAAATAIPGIPMQAWDIGLTNRGPVPVEANIGGDFNLAQIVEGKGLMDDRFRAFLAARGIR